MDRQMIGQILYIKLQKNLFGNCVIIICKSINEMEMIFQTNAQFEASANEPNSDLILVILQALFSTLGH